MIVSDSYVLGQVTPPVKEELRQPTYPKEPKELPGLPYRISAFTVDMYGNRVPWVKVQLLDASGKKLIGERTTDSEGKVYFDLPSNLEVTLRPTAPSGMVAIPPWIAARPISISGTPLLNVFTDEWDWEGNSFSFVIQDAMAPEKKPEDESKKPDDDIWKYVTWKNALIVVGVIVGAVWLKNMIFGED